MATTHASTLDALTDAVAGHAAEATEADSVAGVAARWVASPGSTQEAAALIAVAANQRLHVVVRGRGTALHWAPPPREVDLVVSTHRLDGVVEHVAGDLVAVVRAGTTIDAVNAQAGEHGQQLALDQPIPGSSVAGAMSTTRSGPRRMLCGTPRDLVLGTTLVRADGVVARSGGKVVKNVAGYDLAKLLGGAYGTLGLITELVVRLHPVPPSARWLSRTVAADRATAMALELAGSQLAPTAVEVRCVAGSQDATVLVLLEGTERGVGERAVDATRLLGLDSADGADLVTGDLARLDAGADDVVVNVAVPLTGVAGVLTAARTVEQQHGVACRVQGSAGVGMLYAVLSSGEGVARGTSGKARARQSEPGEADPVAASIEVLRAAAAGGSAVVLQAPASVRSLVDSWGPVAALDVMRRVKAEFDPEHRFAPGRFVGGI